jgi:hypothetical protein
MIDRRVPVRSAVDWLEFLSTVIMEAGSPRISTFLVTLDAFKLMASVSQVHRAFSNDMTFTVVRQPSSTDVSNFGPHFLKNDPITTLQATLKDSRTITRQWGAYIISANTMFAAYHWWVKPPNRRVRIKSTK